MTTSVSTSGPRELRIAAIHRDLGIPADYERRGLPLQQEAGLNELVTLPLGRFEEPITLTSYTAGKWQELSAAAKDDGIELCISFGFRSIEDQAAHIRRYLCAGDSIDKLLSQFAAPGYSEHHTGRAVDIGISDCEGLPFSHNYERAPSFKWLTRNANAFGFSMSYPEGNSFGLIYEPWHWILEERHSHHLDLTSLTLGETT